MFIAIYLKFEPLRVPLWIQGFGTDICFEGCISKLDLGHKRKKIILAKYASTYKEFAFHPSQLSEGSMCTSVQTADRITATNNIEVTAMCSSDVEKNKYMISVVVVWAVDKYC